MNLGQYITNIIEQQGRTKAWVAEQCDIKYKTFVDKLKRNSIDGEELLRISIVLNINLEDLKNKYKGVLKMENKKELLNKILEQTSEWFDSYQKDGKVLVKTIMNDVIQRAKYTVENKQDILDRIENRFNLYIEELENEEDEEYINEKLENLDSDEIFIQEFDGEYLQVAEYYNPIESLKNEDYKYTYLICFVDHTNTHRSYLETVVYCNKEIYSETEMTEVLEKQEESIPGEFGIAWANYYFKELNEFDKDDLYLFLENENYNSIEIE